MSLVSLLALGLAGLCAPAIGGGPSPLQPCDYASVAGDWVLHVDPTQRFGAGPARCRMTHAGALAWEHELAFTFREAVVASDGSVVGYALTEGINRIENELEIAVLAPDGEVRGSERERRRWIPSGRVCPNVSRLDLYEQRDVAVLVVEVPDGVELWSYELSTGRARGRVAEDSGKRLSPRARSKPAPLPPFDPPTLELASLGDLRFEVPFAPRNRERLRFLTLDALGRVLFELQPLGKVMVCDRTGRLLFLAEPESGDVNAQGNFVEWAIARADGGVSLCFELSDRDRRIDFGPDGRRIDRSPVTAGIVACSWPARKESWLVDTLSGRIGLIDGAGAVVRSIERGANGRWLTWLSHPVVASDGSLAVLSREEVHSVDRFLQRFDGEGRPVLSVPLPFARPVQALAFDGSRSALLLADGVGVALNWEGDVMLLDSAGVVLGRVALSEVPYPDGLLFSPEGELWVFEREVAHRFALPR